MKSRQQLIDESMCKPGFTWNETLKRCIGAYGGEQSGSKKPDKPAKPENPEDISGAGRNETITNPNGIQQTGTNMKGR